jgi:lipid-binding SYLF domain-containing protein
MLNRRSLLATAASSAVIGLSASIAGGPAQAAGRTVIDTRVRMALDQMFAQLPGTRDLAAQARGMLVMPSVVKGGFIFGGAYGEGALLPGGGQGGGQGATGPASGYYSVASASVGLQLGVQSSHHVLFFMTDDALERFRRADGWEVGADAEVTLPESGMNLQLNSTLMNKPVIGIVFGQDGFLLGASLEGSKYSPIAR